MLWRKLTDIKNKQTIIFTHPLEVENLAESVWPALSSSILALPPQSQCSLISMFVSFWFWYLDHFDFDHAVQCAAEPLIFIDQLDMKETCGWIHCMCTVCGWRRHWQARIHKQPIQNQPVVTMTIQIQNATETSQELRMLSQRCLVLSQRCVVLPLLLWYSGVVFRVIYIY